ncbi:MAG: V-type ATP synthase subunit D [Candidatus Diapherotrites archaeon]|nr:V-type ATP synthase subunit D [Candidatus Diapherotrites archaeon]
MGRVKLTRMELLKLRRKRKLAEKGHKLLKQKNDTLVMEFFSTLKEIRDLRKGFGEKFARAQKTMARAQAIQGEPDIARLALGTASGVELEYSTRNVMGVEVPMISLVPGEQQWYGLYESTVELDEAVTLHRELLPDLLRLVEKQLALKKLAEEIKKTKRRVNSLEYIAIPAIKSEEKMITLKLDELERESFTRLKKIKDKAGGKA